MTNLASAFQPALDELEKDYANLERQANALLTAINLLRSKSGMPPRPGGFHNDQSASGQAQSGAGVKLHSDSFTGMKLSSAVRKFLDLRKQSGGDAPATTREIFDALKEGGFVTGAKDDANAMVILRTMLRKNTTSFAKLQNGKYGLRSWYGNLKPPKDKPTPEAGSEAGEVDDEEVIVVNEKGTATATKAAAGS